MKKELKEGADYYLDERGYFVFTTGYHLERGYCCKSGCRHCPYEYRKESESGKQFVSKDDKENK